VEAASYVIITGHPQTMGLEGYQNQIIKNRDLTPKSWGYSGDLT
jgi:hypothetical protein